MKSCAVSARDPTRLVEFQRNNDRKRKKKNNPATDVPREHVGRYLQSATSAASTDGLMRGMHVLSYFLQSVRSRHFDRRQLWTPEKKKKKRSEEAANVLRLTEREREREISSVRGVKTELGMRLGAGKWQHAFWNWAWNVRALHFHTQRRLFFLFCFAEEPQPCGLAYFKFVLCNECPLKNKQLSKMFLRVTYFKLIIRVIFNFLKETGHLMCGKRIKTMAGSRGSRITWTIGDSK